MGLMQKLKDIPCSIAKGQWHSRFKPFMRRNFVMKEDLPSLLPPSFEQVIKNQEAMLKLLENIVFENRKPPYRPGDKIRLVFWFQVPSFWPALEALYEECVHDERFEVTVVCHDEFLHRTVNTEGARDFLESRNIPYIYHTDFNFQAARPHILFFQAPYDSHRTPATNPQLLRSLGIRLAYLGYGLEFPETRMAMRDHYHLGIYSLLWRLYTFSEKMLPHYRRHMENSACVRALGSPRFDPLFHKEKFPLHPEIRERAGGRPIVLWKAHFPKCTEVENTRSLITPEPREYLRFVSKIKKYPDFFFVFMPHPAFVEWNQPGPLRDQAELIMKAVRAEESVFVDNNPDHRPSVLHSDLIIIDRSTVMFDVGLAGVPVLYMRNAGYKEPMVDAAGPVIEAYYQGSRCEDMLAFLERCGRRKEDPRRADRERAWRECMPLCDGNAARRIKEDLALSMSREMN